ncbi:hypothetical protein HK101_009653 [Irineochytrium annulatum]|nr:hypothetical protein HK101_009653 [Irineochytrium annulatum]
MFAPLPSFESSATLAVEDDKDKARDAGALMGAVGVTSPRVSFELRGDSSDRAAVMTSGTVSTGTATLASPGPSSPRTSGAGSHDGAVLAVTHADDSDDDEHEEEVDHHGDGEVNPDPDPEIPDRPQLITLFIVHLVVQLTFVLLIEVLDLGGLGLGSVPLAAANGLTSSVTIVALLWIARFTTLVGFGRWESMVLPVISATGDVIGTLMLIWGLAALGIVERSQNYYLGHFSRQSSITMTADALSSLLGSSNIRLKMILLAIGSFALMLTAFNYTARDRGSRKTSRIALSAYDGGGDIVVHKPSPAPVVEDLPHAVDDSSHSPPPPSPLRKTEPKKLIKQPRIREGLDVIVSWDETTNLTAVAKAVGKLRNAAELAPAKPRFILLNVSRSDTGVEVDDRRPITPRVARRAMLGRAKKEQTIEAQGKKKDAKDVGNAAAGKAKALDEEEGDAGEQEEEEEKEDESDATSEADEIDTVEFHDIFETPNVAGGRVGAYLRYFRERSSDLARWNVFVNPGSPVGAVTGARVAQLLRYGTGFAGVRGDGSGRYMGKKESMEEDEDGMAMCMCGGCGKKGGRGVAEVYAMVEGDLCPVAGFAGVTDGQFISLYSVLEKGSINGTRVTAADIDLSWSIIFNCSLLRVIEDCAAKNQCQCLD